MGKRGPQMSQQFYDLREARMPHPAFAIPLIWAYVLFLAFIFVVFIAIVIYKLFQNNNNNNNNTQLQNGETLTSGENQLQNSNSTNSGKFSIQRLPSDMKIVVQPNDQGYEFAVKEDPSSQSQKFLKVNKVGRKKSDSAKIYLTDQISEEKNTQYMS